MEEPSDSVVPEPEAPLVPSVSGNPGDPAADLPFNRTPLEADDETIVDELTERREEGTKHFLLADGSRTAVVDGFPVHEKDAAGEWTEIDNTLRPVKNSAGGYDYVQVSLSRQTTFFGDPESGRLFRLERPDGAPEWGVLTPETGEIKIGYEPFRGEEGKEKLAVKALSGLLSYEGFLPDSLTIVPVLKGSLPQ